LLDNDEICHWKHKAKFKFLWRSGSHEKDVDGELVVTSKRVIFISETKTFDFPPAMILEAVNMNEGVRVTCLKQSASGIYVSQDSEELEAVLALQRSESLEFPFSLAVRLARRFVSALVVL